jgi:hypothetical protein
MGFLPPAMINEKRQLHVPESCVQGMIGIVPWITTDSFSVDGRFFTIISAKPILKRLMHIPIFSKLLLAKPMNINLLGRVKLPYAVYFSYYMTTFKHACCKIRYG